MHSPPSPPLPGTKISLKGTGSFGVLSRFAWYNLYEDDINKDDLEYKTRFLKHFRKILLGSARKISPFLGISIMWSVFFVLLILPEISIIQFRFRQSWF